MIGRQLDLRPARAADLPFIMATERISGFEAMVGRWPEEDHLAALKAPDYAYFIGVTAAATDADESRGPCTHWRSGHAETSRLFVRKICDAA